MTSPAFGSEDEAAVDFQRAEAPLSLFLSWAAQVKTSTPQRLYIAQAPVDTLPDALRDDLPTPELVLKVGKGDIYNANIWLGVAPTYTPLHRDPNPNLYLQLAGRKVVRLLDPDAGHSVFTAVQTSLQEHGSSKFRGEDMMRGPERSILEKIIWMEDGLKTAELEGFEASLDPGEALFIPNGWWHSVKSVGEGCTGSQVPAQSTNEDDTVGSKRKKKDGNEAGSRTKRNRYVSIACEYRTMSDTIHGLQDQVQRLYAELNSARPSHDNSTSPYPNPPTYPHQPSMIQPHSQGPYHATSPPASHSRIRHRQFQGPTSSAFNIDVANSSLQTMGLTDPSLIESEVQDYNDIGPTSPHQRHGSNPHGASHGLKDPIWSIGKDEAIRLCRVYDEEIGMMYPMLDMDHIVSKVDELFTFTEAATRTGLINQDKASPDSMNGPQIDTFKMIFATVLVLEGGGQSELGSALFETVRGACESKLGEPLDIQGLRLLVIMVQAYSRIASKVWRSITTPAGAGGEVEENTMGYLDYQILQWQNTIPDLLRFYPTVDIPDTGPVSRAQQRLQVLLYLRMNQMRILIYRPVLHSATSIMEQRRYAGMVIEVAKDTIRVLRRLNQTTDIYRTQQVCFNHFLISALAALFLAVSHAPAEFNQTVRDEFYMAIDLVRGFSAQSYVSMRLWQTIKGLKEIGPRLGLFNQQQPLTDSIDPHSSAAVAMAGLAGHRVDEMTAFPVTQGPAAVGQAPVNGQQMGYELTNLFEAAGGYHNAVVPPNNQVIDHGSGYPVGREGTSHNSTGDGARGSQANDREFSKIMQALY
ncbi:MAG: hypothetical protein Q9174_001003 [Haloplaca sp. 1 TL-2023]